jgi:putative ABC transport system ATP-binding protein
MLITLKNITKQYELGDTTYTALRGVDLTIEEGEFVAIVGASGSGKSTLMNIIGALDVPSHGNYLLEGIEVSELGDDELAQFRNKQIGFVFQQFNLLKNMNVADNVALPGRYAHTEQLKEKVAFALEAVGLTSKAKNRPNQLSGGQMQRVAIARALLMSPSIILADEPTGNLDSQTGISIMEIFEALHRQGHTIVIVTHAADVARRASRVVEMRDGQILSDTKGGSK